MTIAEDRALIAAAGATDAELAGVVADLGTETVADMLLAEIVFRAALDDLVPAACPVRVAVVLSHDGASTTRMVEVAHDVRISRETPREQPLAVVDEDLLGAVRAVYGPPTAATSPARAVTWPGLWPDFPSLAPKHYPRREIFDTVRRIVDALDGDEAGGLAAFAVRHRTDKWGLHQYTPHYEYHFSRLRHQPVQLLEIGVGGQGEADIGGESLNMWKRYFPRGIIRGVDIEDKTRFAGPRVDIATVDQADAASLIAYVEAMGAPDIVIDDGSHLSSDVIASFRTLFPYLRAGGWYVVEDVQTSYWPFDGGDDTDLNNPRTSMGFLKSLIDGLNHEEFLSGSGRISLATDDLIRGMHFYHNIVFIEKGSNREGSPIARALEKEHPAETPGHGR